MEKENRDRVCNECGILKPLTEFYKAKESLGGYRTKCKTCCRERERGSKEKIPAAVRSEKFKDYRMRRRAKVLSVVARYRAKEKGVEFGLTMEDIADLQTVIDLGTCQLTGIPFNLNGGKTWDSPSLDRIDSARGYVRENVRVVLYCVNVMANIWGPNKILEIASAIRKERSTKSDRLQARLEAALRARLTGSPECEVIWKPWTTPWGQCLSKPRARVRRSIGIVIGLWPTPNATDGDKAPQCCARGNPSLPTAVKMALWPSNRSSPNENRNTRSAPSHYKGHGVTVAGLVQDTMRLSVWSALRSTDGAKGGPNQSFGAGGSPLPSQVYQTALLPEPSLSSARMANGGGSLHPEFAGWEMGFSPEYLACAPSETPSMPRSRQK